MFVLSSNFRLDEFENRVYYPIFLYRIKDLSFDLYKETLIKILNSFQQIREKNEGEK